MGPMTDAVCQAAKWLKSSVEKLFGKCKSAAKQSSERLQKGSKES
jgi:hypothetical protein